VLYLVVVLLLVWAVLAAVLWGVTMFGQGFLYEEPPSEVYWRAPAAAGVVTAVLALWCLLNRAFSEPGQREVPLQGLFNFTTETISDPVRQLTADGGSGPAVVYKRFPLSSIPPRHEYRDGNVLWNSSRVRDTKVVTVQEGDREVRFIKEDGKEGGKEAGSGRFVEEGGSRVLTQDGRITTPRRGRVFLSVLLNVLLFVAWFAAVWLLLRFHWPHALLLAAVLWLITTLGLSSLFDKVPVPAPARTAAVRPVDLRPVDLRPVDLGPVDLGPVDVRLAGAVVPTPRPVPPGPAAASA